MEKAAEVKNSGKKRKFDPLILAGEKEKNLKLLQQMTSKKPKLDVSKAVGKQINEEEQGNSEAKRSKKKNFGGKRKGGGGKKGGRKGGQKGKKK